MPVDPSAYVAPTARVHPDAIIGPGTKIGEFCIVESDVVIGRECLLEPYVYVKRWTTMGNHNEISAGTVLGTDPLDKVFTGERSYLRIGDRNRIREHYTISRGTKPDSRSLDWRRSQFAARQVEYFDREIEQHFRWQSGLTHDPAQPRGAARPENSR